MAFFRIIVPNYNNEEWLDKCLGSVLEQTYQDYDLVFVDDCSTDGSYEKAKKLIGDRGTVYLSQIKRWNGGSRNVGLEFFYCDSKYTLFLDSDDWFADKNVLQDLHDFIELKDEPDCVRLPFILKQGDKLTPIMLNDNTAPKLVRSIFVACWTKCVKTELVQPFPENTLMEDVVQHIKQCDVIGPHSVAVFNRPVVVYNKDNSNSCSNEQNQDLQHGKWQSSMFRYMADLLDLELTKPYCIEHRDWRAKVCLENIKNDVYSHSV